MKIKKRPKKRLVDEMLVHNKFRGNLADVSVNFIQSISIRYSLMQETIKLYESSVIKDEMFSLALGQYITSLVSCWETFFRDTILFIVESNENLKMRVQSLIVEKNIDINELEKNGISIGEFFCKQYNFQDLNETCKALNFVLEYDKCNIEDYFEESLFNNIIFQSLNIVVYWMQEKKNVSEKLRKIFEKTFEIRNRVIHDSNYKMDIDENFINISTDCFVIFPQLISILIVMKYNQKMFVINTEKNTFRIGYKFENENYLLLCPKDFEAKYTLTKEDI